MLDIFIIFEQQAQHTKSLYNNSHYSQYQVIEITYMYEPPLGYLSSNNNKPMYDKVTRTEIFCLYALSNTPSSHLGFTKHTLTPKNLVPSG